MQPLLRGSLGQKNKEYGPRESEIDEDLCGRRWCSTSSSKVQESGGGGPEAGCTALRMLMDYGHLKKCTKNHCGSVPNMEHTLELIASCRYQKKVDKRTVFWQVDLAAATKDPPSRYYP